MPQVPVYDTKVQGQNLPNIRVDTNAPLEAFGAGAHFNALTNEIEKVAYKAKKDADEISLMEAESKLMNYENDFFYGENGAIKKEGKDSFGLKQSLDESFKRNYDDIYNNLPNQNVKDTFQKRANSRKQSMDSSIMRHISNETTKYDDKTTSDYINNEIGSAIQNYQNPDRVNMSLDAIKSETLKYAQRKGFEPESSTTKALLNKNVSKAHMGIISRMVKNGDDIAAESYYKSVKNEIKDGTDQATIDAELQMGSTLGFAQRFVDNVMSRGLSEGQAYKEAMNLDPKKRQAVEQRINQQFNMKKQAEIDYQNTLFESAIKNFDSTGNDDATVVTKMDAKTKIAYDAYRNKNPLRDDGVLYYKLLDLATNPKTRPAFLNSNPYLEKGNLSETHFDTIMKYHMGLKNNDSATNKQLDGIYSDKEVVSQMYIGSGLNVKNLESFNKYKMKADEAIENYKIQNKKGTVTDEEIRTIVTPLLKKEIDGKYWLWPTKKPRYQIEVENIPLSDLDLIKKTLVKQNKPLSEKNIIDLYILRSEQK